MTSPGADRIQPIPLRSPELPFWAIGHRGFPVAAPENTLVSFDRAVSAGADMVEFDVTLSRDRVPVVLHDRTLNRTTTGRGKVSSRTFEELRRLDAGVWFGAEFKGQKIQRLAEVLDRMRGKAAVNVEIKAEAVGRRIQEGIEEKVLAALAESGMGPHAVVSSFFPLAVLRIKRLAPAQSAALLLSGLPRRDLRKVLESARADALHLAADRVSPEMIRALRKSGFPIRAYTVNEEPEMRKLLEWGVDGIFTDRIDRLVSLR